MSFYASAKVKSLKLEKRTFYQSTDNGVIFTFVTSSKSGTKKRDQNVNRPRGNEASQI